MLENFENFCGESNGYFGEVFVIDSAHQGLLNQEQARPEILFEEIIELGLLVEGLVTHLARYRELFCLIYLLRALALIVVVY